MWKIPSVGICTKQNIVAENEMNENITVKGHLRIVDENGVVVLDQDNLVVSAGKDWIAGMMTGTGDVMVAMAAGTGSGTTTVEMTSLVNELDRVALTVPGGSLTDNMITYTATFGLTDAVGPLVEFALFDSLSADTGNMLCRTSENTVNKPDTMSYTASWTVTLPY